MQEKKRKHRTNRNEKDKNNAKRNGDIIDIWRKMPKKAKNMSSIT